MHSTGPTTGRTMRHAWGLLAAGCMLLLAVPSTFAQAVRVDADFPGGNIAVQRLDGDTLYLAPDLRDTVKGQWWFYWNFRLHAPPERPVKVVFTEKNPIGVRGPAFSTNGGVTWQWMGAKAVESFTLEGKPAWSFNATVPEGARDVRYAFCIPYQQSHLETFLARHQASPCLRQAVLCQTRDGRDVELLRAGRLQNPQGRVLLTSRHHACESMGSYVVEGFLEAVLSETETGRHWRERWEVLAVPFMDKDGVERGDQGKFRHPHDHNRDYNEQPLYPEVAAWMKLGASLKGTVVATLDVHCPWIRGTWNDRAYFVGPDSARFWQAQTNFAQVLARVQEGPIRFRAEDCLEFGKAWNTGGNYRQGRSVSRWAREAFPDAQLVASMEVAYAGAHGDEVNAASARALGRDLARAMLEFLDEKR